MARNKQTSRLNTMSKWRSKMENKLPERNKKVWKNISYIAQRFMNGVYNLKVKHGIEIKEIQSSLHSPQPELIEESLNDLVMDITGSPISSNRKVIANILDRVVIMIGDMLPGTINCDLVDKYSQARLIEEDIARLFPDSSIIRSKLKH